MTTLLVVAHPDDEVLGAGASATTWARQGERVVSCILSGDVEARRHRPDLEVLRSNAREASSLLGMEEPIFGTFPNIAFNSIPHLELVQFIERTIQETGATRIITHHPGDLNDDHLQTSRACQAASRLYQRRDGVPPLSELLFMEVPSSTDWAFPGTLPRFNPDAYQAVSEAAISAKIHALACYEGVMRPVPHPRSDEVLRALASTRGAQCGSRFAEAFQTAFRRLG